jgi:hypothetical protein
VTVRVNEHLPPATVYVYVPDARLAVRERTLGPFAAAPFEMPSDIDEHLVNDRLAEAPPAPTATLKLRVGLAGFRDPVNVTVCAVGAGGGAGAAAAATTAVAGEAVVDEPALFVAVTATRSVEPTSPDCTTYVEEVAPETAPQPVPAVSQRCQA